MVTSNRNEHLFTVFKRTYRAAVNIGFVRLLFGAVLRLPITFSQIADGGDFEPQMFGLTTKFNKMSEVSTTTEPPAIGNVLLAAAFPLLIEIIRKRFPVSIDIQETECNSMKNNHDRLLLKKEYYNEYCLVEINKGTQQLGFTIFKSDWKDFSKIESDFMEGFSFAPKERSEVFVIMNTLV